MKIITLSLIGLLMLRIAPAASPEAGSMGQDASVPGLTTGAMTRSFLDEGSGEPREVAAARVSRAGAQLRGSVWRSLGATLLVIGLLLIANYWVRRRGRGKVAVGRSGRLSIVDRVAVDTRRCILLLEADGERLVVGVGADRIETLTVLSGDMVEPEEDR